MNTKIYYIVEHADWEIKGTNTYNDMGWEHVVPSKKIDTRTLKQKEFFKISEAKRYAKQYLKYREKESNDLRWLAYIEIKKVELLEKIK